MLEFYFNGSPNPTKVALFLEESGLAYQPKPIEARKGQQFTPEFLAVNPNGKVPAIVDDGVTVFDSNAILLYLAEKTGKFLPPNTPANRGQLLSWLMFAATGVGPFSGQAVHFKHNAPEKVPYAHNRYQFEALRHYGVLDGISPSTATWSATPIRSSTWTCGAGRAWCPTFWAMKPGRSCRTSSDSSTRSRRGPRRPAPGLEGQVHVQDRERRGDAAPYVQAFADERCVIANGGVAPIKALSAVGKRCDQSIRNLRHSPVSSI